MISIHSGHIMKPLTTTLNAIRAHSPCESGWTKLLSNLGKTKPDDEPLEFETILDSNGLDDAMWCLRVLDNTHQRTCRLFSVWCARQVQHLMADNRSLAALDVAEAYANGKATDAELAAAWDAAWDATRDATWAATRDAAWDAAWAATWASTRNAAGAATWDAAGAAARAAAGAATWAAARNATWDATWAAAWAAARDATWAATGAAQTEKFRQICRAGEWVA